jgi:hypothetical protein
MSLPGESGSSDPETVRCAADGPVEPGRAVVSAVECNSARFVDLVEEAVEDRPTTLILTSSARDATPLSAADVCRIPELRNAVAYFGDGTKSVRVRTLSERGPVLREYVDSLRESQSGAFEFADRQFDLHVVG